RGAWRLHTLGRHLQKGGSMKHRAALALVFAAFTALIVTQAPAAKPATTGGVVFVQTNELAGNHVVVYDTGNDGLLTRAATYATGGNGGAAAPGTESDRLASQGSLV